MCLPTVLPNAETSTGLGILRNCPTVVTPRRTSVREYVGPTPGKAPTGSAAKPSAVEDFLGVSQQRWNQDRFAGAGCDVVARWRSAMLPLETAWAAGANSCATTSTSMETWEGTVSTQVFIAAPGREAILLFLTGGVRLGRARRQWSRSHPFPVSSTASHCRRTKSESQHFSLSQAGGASSAPTKLSPFFSLLPFFRLPLLLPIQIRISCPLRAVFPAA
jgi:hypothetical protein